MSARVPVGRRRGFTLIELTVVLAIVGVLALAAQPLAELAVRRAQEAALRDALRALRTAIDEHKRLAEGGRIARGEGGSPYPARLRVLVDGVPLLDEQGRPRADARIYLLRRLPRDPFAATGLDAEDTWAPRSSTSPPSAPMPGDDVFDIASRSDARALDGSRYREW